MSYKMSALFFFVLFLSRSGYAATVELTCTKSNEGVAGQVGKIVIDPDHKTVDGHPAQFTGSKIIFDEAEAGLMTTFVLDRLSLQLTAQDGDRSKWSCAIEGQ